MELRRLEKYKKQFKDLATKIDSFQSYLQTKDRTGEELILPYQVSQATGIDEMAALFILSLAEKEHLVTKKYSVFTEDDTLIGEFDNQNKIPPIIFNNADGKEVDRDHYYVQISFELER